MSVRADLGAHVGLHTLLFSRTEPGQGTCGEPHPRMSRLLR